jgi:septation ring formation regulator EzrA
MAEETTTDETQTEETPKTEEHVPYERFQQANRKAKENADRAKALEASVAELKAAMEEREQAGLPELDRMRKDLERITKRAEEAEAKAADADKKLARSTKAGWVRAAAKDFTDPDDAVAFLNLDDLEDERDAERVVKNLAKTKKHLLKGDEPQLPGRVLQNGQPAQNGARTDPALDEAYMLSNALKDFVAKQ